MRAALSAVTPTFLRGTLPLLVEVRRARGGGNARHAGSINRYTRRQQNGRSHFNQRVSKPRRFQSVFGEAGDTRVRRVAPDERLLARRQLPVGRADLSLRQSAAEEAAEAVAREAAGGRALGHDA